MKPIEQLIEIEVYKDTTIYYDDDLDKFCCVMEMSDTVREAKRGSLKDLRKEVDQFIKVNLDFKPFKAILKSSYSDSWEVGDVVAIRTDGKLVFKNTHNRSEHLSLKDSARLYHHSNDIIEATFKAESEYDAAHKKRNKALKEIRDSFKPIDLSKYDLK